MFSKFLIDYYNYVNVFDKLQTNILSSHRFYNYKLKFIEETNKNALFNNRIYSILKYKFEQVKNYLNEHLKKKIIVSSYILFALFVLFIKNLNRKLRFCVDYEKLNVIIKEIAILFY